MDRSTIYGVLLALLGLIGGFLVQEHYDLRLLLLLLQPSAFYIVFIGTIGAVIASFPLSELPKVPSLFKMVLIDRYSDEVEIVNELAELAKKFKKDGMLGIDKVSNTHKNPLIKKGLAMITYGVEPDTLKETLEREVVLRENIYEVGEKMFMSAGGFAPTMGVIGTVMGMVGVLRSISEINAMVNSISTAFVATLYGVCSANILWIPFANKIKFKLEKESRINNMIIEGILSIQSGESPQLIKEKLNISVFENMKYR